MFAFGTEGAIDGATLLHCVGLKMIKIITFLLFGCCSPAVRDRLSYRYRTGDWARRGHPSKDMSPNRNRYGTNKMPIICSLEPFLCGAEFQSIGVHFLSAGGSLHTADVHHHPITWQGRRLWSHNPWWQSYRPILLSAHSCK